MNCIKPCLYKLVECYEWLAGESCLYHTFPRIVDFENFKIYNCANSLVADWQKICN